MKILCLVLSVVCGGTALHMGGLAGMLPLTLALGFAETYGVLATEEKYATEDSDDGN